MSLGFKVLLFTAVTSGGLFCALYFTVGSVLQGSVHEVEREQARIDLARLQATIDRRQDHLAATATDWAYWNETYHFLKTGDPSYIQTNLDPTTLANLSLNLMAFVRRSGEIVGTSAVDLETHQPAAAPADLAQAAAPTSPLLSPSAVGESRVGILMLDGRPMMVAAVAVLTSDRRGPSPGVLIAGRWLDDAEWSLVADLVQLELSAFPFDAAPVAADIRQGLQANAADSDPVVEILDDRRLAAYHLLYDLEGEPVVLVQAIAPRPALQVARRAAVSLAVGLGVVALAWAALTTVYLHGMILGRVSRLSSALARIERQRDPSERVQVEGADELGQLAGGINRMLASLEQSGREQRQNEERYRRLLETQGEGFLLVDDQERVLFANPAAESLFGVPPGGLQGKGLQQFTTPEGFAAIRAQSPERRAGRTTTYEIDILRPDGEQRRLIVTGSPYTDASGAPLGTVGVLRDITERHHMERRLEYLSTHDPLTGLYNRGFFDQELERLQRDRRFPVSIIVVDIDLLKAVNDLEGHPAGDQLLQRFARVLGGTFRGDDVVARTGGDEFAVILPETDAEAGEQALARLRARLEEHNRQQPEQPLSISLGVATAVQGQPLTETLAEADRRMYEAKAQRVMSFQANGRRKPG